MDRQYIIRRLPETVSRMPLAGAFAPEHLPEPWSGLDEAKIDRNPWMHLDSDYLPPCAARLGWNAQGIHVLMYADEPVIRAKETRVGGEVYLDSCLECFLSPDPERPNYVNCEINPLAVMHIGLGDKRHGRHVFAQVPKGFHPVSSQHAGSWWAVSYTIPAEFLQEYFGVTIRSGARVRGNFYKCGDPERHDHHLMFHPYATKTPDYHRPELFPEMRLE